MSTLPDDWARALAPALAEPWWPALQAFVAEEREKYVVFPPESEVFAALALTPFEAVAVVILGQDPYQNLGQAHGLAFSVRPGVTTPPSLANIYRELRADLGIEPPEHGYLAAWAERGVLLLNAVLTVRDGAPGSHANQGWEKLTDAVIDALNARAEPVVFVLWGGYAKKKAARVTGAQHRVLEGVHPSPLSAKAGFFGSKPFSAVNRLLAEVGRPPRDWSLPRDPGPVFVPERPSDPAIRALQGDPPPVPSLEKALGLGVWDGLIAEDQAAVARAVEGVLPRDFRFVEVREVRCGDVVRRVAHFDRAGEPWVLVPGGDLALGWSGVKAKLGVPRRRMWAADCRETPEPEAWLAANTTPARQVTVRPFLAAVEAAPLRRWCATFAEDAPIDAHQQVGAALAALGLALPTPDEWEHLAAGGARALFAWGAAWPADLPAGARPETSPFGARIAFDARRPEATRDVDVWRAGGAPAPGMVREAWSAPSARVDLRAVAATHRWRELLSDCRVRPVRPVFPYARR